MRRWMKSFAGAVVLLVALAGFAEAKNVTLAWDASPESTVVGYRIYYQAGSSAAPLTGTGAAEGASPVDIGSRLTATLTGLADSQTHYFAVTAYDAAGNESPYSNLATSAPVVVNRPPVLAAVGARTVAEGTPLTFSVSASDPDGNALSYSAGTLPAGASFNAATRTFSWTPSYTQAGSYTVNFVVSDGSLSDSEAVTVTVTNSNRPPVLSAIGPQSLPEGGTLSLTLSASDPDGNTLSYSAGTLPAGAVFNASTRVFSWTPSYTQAGSYTVNFAVSDGSLSDSEAVTLTVTNSNRAPVLAAIGSRTVAEGVKLTFTVNASDPDGDALTYNTGSLPAGAVFNASTRVFSWTPVPGQAGSYNVVISVSDGVTADGELVAITVTAAAAADSDGDGVIDSQDSFPLDPSRSLWSIQASATTGGSITPSGETLLSYGGSQNYTFSAAPGYSVTDLLVDGVSYGPRGSYLFSNVTAHHTIEAVFSNFPDGLSLPANDLGLPGIERADGGSDSDNLVGGKPKADLDYVFSVVLRDNPSNLPVAPRLFLNGHGYEMTLTSGEVGSGALYTFTTKLGPLAPCRYRFEVRDQQGNLLWAIPQSGDLEGPRVELLNGANFVGMPKNIAAANLGSIAALGTASSYRWVLDGSGQVVYSPVDNGASVAPGEGYVVYRGSNPALPALAQYGEVTQAVATIPLHGGWNILTNPYLGNQTLSQVRFRQAGGAALGWEQAVAYNWLFNALYQYVGKDWGSGYLYESLEAGSDPVLIPGIGYLVYINPAANITALEIPRPL